MANISREDLQKYVLTSLGYPVVSVELAPEQLGQAIDIAITEYLSTGSVEIDYADYDPTPLELAPEKPHSPEDSVPKRSKDTSVRPGATSGTEMDVLDLYEKLKSIVIDNINKKKI